MRNPIYDRLGREIGYTCDQTGRCVFTNETPSESLSGSSPTPRSRLNREKSLTEMFGVIPYHDRE